MSESNLWDALRTTVDSQVDTNKKLWGALTELLNKVQALEKRVANKELFQATLEELGEAAPRAENARQMLWDASVHTESEEREMLLARHKHEIAKLKLESDRRARRVAERMLALCKLEMSRLSSNEEQEFCMILDAINIEALVDESKL